MGCISKLLFWMVWQGVAMVSDLEESYQQVVAVAVGLC